MFIIFGYTLATTVVVAAGRFTLHTTMCLTDYLQAVNRRTPKRCNVSTISLWHKRFLTLQAILSSLCCHCQCVLSPPSMKSNFELPTLPPHYMEKLKTKMSIDGLGSPHPHWAESCSMLRLSCWFLVSEIFQAQNTD